MSLVIDISVNRKTPVGTVYAHRIEGDMGEVCRYKCSVDMKPHPITGEYLLATDILVEHHYNDSPLSLLKKILEAVDPGEAT